MARQGVTAMHAVDCNGNYYRIMPLIQLSEYVCVCVCDCMKATPLECQHIPTKDSRRFAVAASKTQAKTKKQTNSTLNMRKTWTLYKYKTHKSKQKT